MPGNVRDASLDATAAAQPLETPASAAGPRLATQIRATILPRIKLTGEQPELVQEGGDRYERIRTIGSGGVGEVALVRDNDIHRMVALKQIKREHDGPSSLMRFVDEIQTIGQLEHPGIVPIHDVGIDEQGRYFFVMKYVEGETLEAIIEKLARGDADTLARYPIARRTQVFLQVLRAVQFAHARGVIHRDLKPANVMVGRFGEVMVMDWGVAKRLDPAAPATEPAPPLAHAATLEPEAATDLRPERLFRTHHGSLLGTPAYMAPEQARGQVDAIDRRSDVYSLCALFYEMVFLRHYLPPQKSLPEMLHAVIHDKPSGSGPKELPPDLVHLALNGLEKDPANRYQSVDEMIARLERAISGRCDVTCPMTMMKRSAGEFSRFVDRHPVVALLASVATAGILIYGAVQLVVNVL